MLEFMKRQFVWFQEGRFSEAHLKEAITQIGVVEFEEIREVLASENMIFVTKDNSEVFIEFIAYWVQLSYFTPELVQQFFPSLKDPKKINLLLNHFGIKALEILKASQMPHTLPLEDLLISKLKREGVSEGNTSLEVYEFKYHYQNVFQALRHELREQQNEAKVNAHFKPIIQKLLDRCIQKDCICFFTDF
jgi:hypothetical protein